MIIIPPAIFFRTSGAGCGAPRCQYCDKTYPLGRSWGALLFEYHPVLGILLIVAIVWLFVTVTAWLLDQGVGETYTLMDMLKSQVRFVSKLRLI
jgi:hypothetical protein